MDKSQRGALGGVRVVEFGQYVAAPVLGMLLADQGADVIKVERPDGDPIRHEPAFEVWNRGKRSVVLDLHTQSGIEAAKDLVRTADVVIENLRPGLAKKFGIDDSSVADLNPDAIHCSLPAYSYRSGRQQESGWEPLVSAQVGIYSPPPGLNSAPTYLPLPAASIFAALNGAVCVVMALLARSHGGGGQSIEAPLFDGLFSTVGVFMVKMHDTVHMPHFPFGRDVMRRQYKCGDGAWVQLQGMYQPFVAMLMTAAETREWLPDLQPAMGQVLSSEMRATWIARFEQLFLSRTSFEWEEAINEAGGACVRCNTVDEWLAHQHAIESGQVIEVETPTLGRMKQAGVPVRLSNNPHVSPAPGPALGEHTDQLDSENFWRDDAAPTHASSQPESQMCLDGIRVLDLCIVLAGPTCGRILADFGADVLKIDDPNRPYDLRINIDVNRGKSPILLDIHSTQGQKTLWQLIDDADVIIENYRDGSLQRLGFGYEAVKKRYPGIVYASINAFGHSGPWRSRAGWEELAQACSGIQTRRGGRNSRPLNLPLPMCDYGTGLLGALGIAMALVSRQDSGEGQRVTASLTHTAGLLQSRYFLDYAGLTRSEPEGRDLQGTSACSRIYQCADSALYLHCTAADWPKLLEISEFSALGEDPHFTTADGRETEDKQLSALLEDIFSNMSVAYWLDTLHAAGVPVAELRSYETYRQDEALRKRGLIATRSHPEVGMATHVGLTATLSKTPMRLGHASKLPGTDTKNTLSKYGIDDFDVDTDTWR